MRHIQSTLSKKQIFCSRLTAGGTLILWGLLLLFAALDGFQLPVARLFLPLSFSVVALLLVTLAFIQENTLLLWLAPAFVFLGLICFLDAYSVAGFGKLYPLLILSPAIGSFLCGLYSGLWKDHIKIILLFLPSCLIFLLNAGFGLSLGITLSVFLLFLGVAAIAYTLHKGVNNER